MTASALEGCGHDLGPVRPGRPDVNEASVSAENRLASRGFPAPQVFGATNSVHTPRVHRI